MSANSSIQSITDIQESLKAAAAAVQRLEAENLVLKWATGIAVTVLVGGAVYETGHALKAW
jgi:hypothetical protein